ncbi:hypothetical protein GCM10019060_21110 [Novosphingobium pokkalii]|nr:hypothetical protein GCM10019060_21110 [Novosphingobium pokkalii]
MVSVGSAMQVSVLLLEPLELLDVVELVDEVEEELVDDDDVDDDDVEDESPDEPSPQAASRDVVAAEPSSTRARRRPIRRPMTARSSCRLWP